MQTKPSGVISLITDFGHQDHFVGTMKGVILSISPHVRLVDLTHQVEPQNIIQASMNLFHSYRYFPGGTVHLAVVDPGVGSSRKILAAETKRHIFVAPDNGLLYPILEEAEEVKLVSVHEKYALEPVSKTFHGRDIFAPVAAWLSLGIPLKEVGDPIQKYEPLENYTPARYSHKISGRVVLIDRFGNLITNIPVDWFDGHPFEIRLGEVSLNQLSKSYAEGSDGPMAIEGSNQCLEIAIGSGSAAQTLDIQVGREVQVLLKD